MHVIVKNKKGEGTFISSVYFKDSSSTTDSVKKEPSTTTGSEGFKYDLFENTYTKEAGKTVPGTGGDTVDTNAKALTIGKEVSGGTADKTKAFDFNLTITLPETNKTSKEPVTTVTAHIGDATETLNVDTAKQTITKTFKLKHGEKFSIDNLPAGSRYSVTETGTPGYTATAVYKENGVARTVNGTSNSDFSVQNVLIGEKTNENNVTNTFADVTPTGLLIDNLPFILMIGLGVAGFVVVARRRRQG
ncbi:EftLSL.A [Streptococcus sp. DD10]|nr:EftLSL.A [Streptococcus sp. DD10]